VEVDQDDQEIIARVAALDVGKAEVVCCVRIPDTGPGGRRLQEVRTFSTMTRSLLALGDWLVELGVTRVVMDATSDYWRPPFYLLEDRFDVWLVNARTSGICRVGRRRLDAVWLCKVAERQMLRASFVPPPAIRELRDLTRYRVDLDRCSDGGEATGGKAPRGRADQSLGGGLGHLRGVRPGDAGGVDRR